MERVEISQKKFAENLENYFNLVEKGTQIVLKRRKTKILITQVIDDDDDNYFTPSMIRRIKHSEQQAVEGQVKTIHNGEELKTLLGL
jgi:transcription termination factor Rho